MGTTLILVGLGCMIAAIIGGGVKLVQLEIAKFTSVSRQAILGGFGVILLLAGLAVRAADNMPSDAADDGQNQAASVALAKNALENKAAPVAAAEPARAAESETGAPAPAAPAISLSGRWTNENGVLYGIHQEGDEFAIVVRTDEGTAIGNGQIDGNRISINFPFNATECEGSVDSNRQVINVNCESEGARVNVILEREGVS